MKPYRITTSLIIVLLLAGFTSCEKHNDSQDNKDKKDCRVTRIKTNNDILDIFYNPDHTFLRSEEYSLGNHQTRFVTGFDRSGNSITINYDSYLNDVKVQHFYATAIVNNDRITSLTFYSCGSCTLTPATYTVDYSKKYFYNASGQMTRFESYNENDVLTGHSDMLYDSKGRFTKEMDYDENEDPTASVVYQYAANDAENYPMGEFDVTPYIFHGSRLIQPLSIAGYDENGTLINNVTYINTPNAEGYLASSAYGSGTINTGTTSYTYQCE